MGVIRDFREADAERVGVLRAQAFEAPAEDVSPADVARHLVDVFLRPGFHPQMRSLVYEDPERGVVGFLGVLSRGGMIGDREIVIGTGTRLMVDPSARFLVGPQLMQRFLSGPQDLSYSDMANEVGRRLFLGLGGDVAAFQSLEWTFALRPARQWLTEAKGLAGSRIFRGLARGPAMAMDAMSRLPEAERRTSVQDLDVGELPGILDGLLGQNQLRPSYREEDVRFSMELLSRRARSGVLRACAVEASGSGIVGWFIYFAHRSRPSRVVQMGYAEGWSYDTLCTLLADARAEGSRVVFGGLDRGLLETLRRVGAPIRHANRWTLVHAKDPNLLMAAQDGRCFLTALDGEWPTSYF